MTTDIRLLSTYKGFSPQDIISLPDAEATNLISQGNASTTLTGGTRRYAPVPVRSLESVKIPVGTMTIRQNETGNVLVPDGYVAVLTGDAAAAGTITRNGAPEGSFPTNSSVIFGPYTGAQVLVVSLTAGTVTAANRAATASGGTVSRKQKSNVLYSCVAGYLNPPSAATTTLSSQAMQRVAEADFGSMRIGLLNASANAQPGIQVAVFSSSTLGAGLPTNATNVTAPTLAASLGINTTSASGMDAAITRRIATWNGGSATGTLTAARLDATAIGGANGGGTETSVTWTDPIVCPSTKRATGDGLAVLPVYWVLIEWPIGSNVTSLNVETFVGSGTAAGLGWNAEGVSGASGVAPFGRPIRVITNSINGMITVPGHLFSSSAAREYLKWPAFIVEYTTISATGETIVTYSDSIDAGNEIADVLYCGWPYELQNMVSTPQNPLSICSLAVGGTTMDEWTRRINTTFAGLSNVNAYTRDLSPNSLGGPISNVNMANAQASFAKNKQALNKAGVFVFTGTIPPTNSGGGTGAKSYGSSWQTLAVPYNDQIRASGMLVVDEDGSTTTQPVLYTTGGVPSGDGTGQYWLKPGYNATGSAIHLSRAAHHQIAVDFAPKWKAA